VSIDSAAQHTQIAIIGSGFSGLGAAINCWGRDSADLVVLERGDEVGGTWRITPIPDARAMSNRTFTHSRSRRIPTGPEIRAAGRDPAIPVRLRNQIRRTAYLRLNTELLGGRWDEGAQLGDWTRVPAAYREYRDLRYRTAQ